MTIRYAFVPLIGDRVYGWMGDTVDALSIVTSIAGVCTSLGLGAMSINAGLQRLSWGSFRGENYAIPDEAKYSNPGCNGQGYACGDGEESFGVHRNTTTQILTILVITCMSTVSVLLGLGRGIKFLSQCVFAMGTFLMLVVALNGETYLILDNIVQVTGYYLWYIVKIGFHCDAWERLGGKDMGLGGVDTGGGSTWIIDWTIFYWGWWISWGPFVGTFIARISKGRTLRVFHHVHAHCAHTLQYRVVLRVGHRGHPHAAHGRHERPVHSSLRRQWGLGRSVRSGHEEEFEHGVEPLVRAGRRLPRRLRQVQEGEVH
jgi:choline/glycine/proline betaine transport protein